MELRFKWYFRLVFLLLLFAVLFIFLKLKPIWFPLLKIVLVIIFPFVISAFITYLLHPVIERISETKLPRWLGILFIYFLFFGGVGVALYKGIPTLIIQLKDLAENAPEISYQYRQWISSIEFYTQELPPGIREKIDEGIIATEEKIDTLFTKVVYLFSNIIDFFVLLAIIPFIVFYMLKDIDLMKKTVWYMTPRKWRKKGMLFLKDIDASLGGYIRGQLLVCTIIGMISAILFWIIKMKYPLLLGFIVGVTNIIPYFGPIIALIPTVIIAATISVKMMIISAGVILVLQFIEGNILAPFIVGKSLAMHPLLIMFALLAGGEIGGVIGLIIAVPVLAIIKVCIKHARSHFIDGKINRER